jgi:hypothetical protein
MNPRRAGIRARSPAWMVLEAWSELTKAIRSKTWLQAGSSGGFLPSRLSQPEWKALASALELTDDLGEPGFVDEDRGVAWW